MNALTIALAALLVTPLAAVPASEPIGTPDKERIRIIDHRLEHDGRTYAWSVMIPPGVDLPGPAVLFLHGYGECGDDGKKHLTVGLPPAVRADPDRWPMVLIVPQKPAPMSEWEDHEGAVLAMLDEAAEKGYFDPGRLAVTGLSQGGHGTIALASRHPDRFRAAAPVCGYSGRRFDERGARRPVTEAGPDDAPVRDAAEALRAMPVWLFHGADDPVVPASESRALHRALKALDADAALNEYAGLQHNCWDAAYAEEGLAAWFVRHTR